MKRRSAPPYGPCGSGLNLRFFMDRPDRTVTLNERQQSPSMTSHVRQTDSLGSLRPGLNSSSLPLTVVHDSLMPQLRVGRFSTPTFLGLQSSLLERIWRRFAAVVNDALVVIDKVALRRARLLLGCSGVNLLFCLLLA